MRRRTFIAGIGSAAAWPVVARGQSQTPVIGFLGILTPDRYVERLVGFRDGLTSSALTRVAILSSTIVGHARTAPSRCSDGTGAIASPQARPQQRCAWLPTAWTSQPCAKAELPEVIWITRTQAPARVLQGNGVLGHLFALFNGCTAQAMDCWGVDSPHPRRRTLRRYHPRQVLSVGSRP